MVICIKNLRVSIILGVYEEERHRERDVIINARLEYDSTQARKTDALEDALDYKQIRDHLVAVVSGTRFKLIETLADRLLAELIKDTRILKVQLEIDKPNALRLADSVSVILNWEKA
jgi:D-erythro-7,8-dihydroneopterin triphosphate epimerase